MPNLPLVVIGSVGLLLLLLVDSVGHLDVIFPNVAHGPRYTPHCTPRVVDCWLVG